MTSKFHKNVVLTGSIDCYCLACDSHLRCKEDANCHIEKPIHKKNLESTQYFEKYKEDHVRKVKKGYYCEFCNILLQTAAKVTLHIAEQKHNDNKGTQLLRRLGNSIISPDDILISENAWNGFIDETCAVCNTEFYSEHIHKTEQKHILNLIQKEIEFGTDNSIYRKIDDSSFQCLTCNMIFALSTITTHSKDENHKTVYAKCRELKPPVLNLFNDKESQKENCSQTANNSIPDKNQKTQTENKTPPRPKAVPKNKKLETDEKVDNQIKNATDLMCNKIKNEQKVNNDVHKSVYKNVSSINYFPAPRKQDPDLTKEEQEQDNQIRTALNVFLNKTRNEPQKMTDIKSPESNIKSPVSDTKSPESDIKKASKVNEETTLFSGNKKKNQTTNKLSKDKKIDVLETDDKKITKNLQCSDKNAYESCLNNDAEQSATTSNKIEVKKGVKRLKKKSFTINKKQCIAKPANPFATNTCNVQKTDEKTNNNETEAANCDTKIKQNSQAVLVQPDSKQQTEAKFVLNTEKQDFSNKYEKAEVLDNVTDYQKNGININFEIGIVYCKKCFGNVNMDCKTIQNHIDEHKNKPETNDQRFTEVLNKNCSKTVLKEIQISEITKDVNQNHNITVNKNQKPTTENNKEIKSSKENALVIYVSKASPEQVTEKVNIQNEATPQPQVAPQEPKDPESFAKANKLTFKKGNKNAFCRLCTTRIPSSLRSMKEHVGGSSHKTKAAKVANFKPVIPKKSMKMFVKQKVEIGNKYRHDIIVNDRLCLSNLSYWMITENDVTLRCQVCEINLTKEDVSRHLNSYFHERAMESTPVVWNLDTEFIREVRPGIFHCGFCNLIVGCWEDVASHLKCEDHEDYRFDASCRLQDHMPAVLEHRRQRETDFLRQLMEFF